MQLMFLWTSFCVFPLLRSLAIKQGSVSFAECELTFLSLSLGGSDLPSLFALGCLWNFPVPSKLSTSEFWTCICLKRHRVVRVHCHIRVFSKICSDFSRTVLFPNSTEFCEFLIAMARKIMHRIPAGPASQRDVRHQSLVSPNTVSATCPAVIGNFQTEVAPNDFQRIIDQFAGAGVGGASYVLSAFGLLRGGLWSQS